MPPELPESPNEKYAQIGLTPFLDALSERSSFGGLWPIGP